MIDLSKLPVTYTTNPHIAKQEELNMFGYGESKAEAEHDLWECIDEYYNHLKKLKGRLLGVIAKRDLDYLNKMLSQPKLEVAHDN